MSIQTPNILRTKQHFEILDGLRGIAAVTVVLFHFLEFAQPDYAKSFAGHGFLAVDFFFCLSGFVIGYAYDDRVKTMGIRAFFVSRLIRLHPLVVFGSVLGLVAFLFDPYKTFGAPGEAYGAGRIALLFLASITMIPLPVMKERGFNLFGLNAPCWSLFWEYIANIVFALVLVRVGKKLLLVLAVAAAAALYYVAWHAKNVMGGWCGANFWEGGARVAFSFLAGLLVYRMNWIIRSKLGFTALSILLLLALTMPYLSWNWLAEYLVVVLYFPLLVSLGAGATTRKATHGICVFSGRISYPLYMVHYWAIWLFGEWMGANKYEPGSWQLTKVMILGTIGLIGLAWLTLRFYDEPLRKWLTNRRKAARV